MAVSDWTFLSSGAVSQSASAYAPAGTVTPPNGTSGAYARSIFVGGPSGNRGGFVPSDPAFTGVPNTKAIRIQTFVYRVSGGSAEPCFSLSAKCSSSNPAGTGYRLSVDNLNFGLNFYAPGFGFVLLPVAGFPAATWHSIRMTVYPIGPTIDRVICERESSPGSGVWSSTFGSNSGDFTIDQSVTPSRYVAWGGTTVNGVFALIQPGVSSGQNATTLFDMTQVSLATAPVPIP